MPLNIAMPPKGDHKENYASVIHNGDKSFLKYYLSILAIS